MLYNNVCFKNSMVFSLAGESVIVTAEDVNKMIDVQFIQTLQDFYAKGMDVALVCVYENNWITDSSNTCAFCREYTRHNLILHERCCKNHRNWEDAVRKTGKPMIFDCHLGLRNFAAPIIIGEEYVGCSIGGQVFVNPPDEKYFRNIAKEFNFNEEEYIAALKNVKIVPEEKLKTVIELLFLISNSIAAITYANFHLAQSGVEYNIPRNKAMEEWFFSNYGKTKRPVSSREYDVLKLLVQGKNNSEIAKELFISVHTAKAHVSSILEKFEVDDRVQVAVKAVREGLI